MGKTYQYSDMHMYTSYAKHRCNDKYWLIWKKCCHFVSLWTVRLLIWCDHLEQLWIKMIKSKQPPQSLEYTICNYSLIKTYIICYNTHNLNDTRLETNKDYFELQDYPLRNPDFDYLFVLQVQIFANFANIKSPTPSSHNRRRLSILQDEDVERLIGWFNENIG